MQVKDLMNKEVITVSETDNLAQLVAKFRTYNYHTLPVVDNEKKVLGLVNSEDIMKVCLPHNPVLEKLLRSTHLYNTEEDDILEMDLPAELGTTVKVSDIMNFNVITIEDSETIAGARKQMKLHNIQRVPVTKNQKSRLILNMRLANRLGIKFPMDLLEKATLVEEMPELEIEK